MPSMVAEGISSRASWIRFDEWDIPEEGGEYPDEPDAFSYDRCRLAVKHHKRIWVSTRTADSIRDSLFCEYVYVIDLDKDELAFFVGGQTHPQEDNPYGTQGIRHLDMKEEYYPCRQSAVFPLRYIRAAGSERIAHDMKQSEKRKDIQTFGMEMAEDETAGAGEYDAEKMRISAALNVLDEKLKCLKERLSAWQPASKNRIRELNSVAIMAKEAIGKLETQIDAIT